MNLVMELIEITDDSVFPPVTEADKLFGELCYGGNLSPELLLDAYSHGIFPWYNEPDPIAWFAPDPRFVLKSSDLKVSKTMRQVLNRKIFDIRYDTAFPDVIKNCSEVYREGQNGTWIGSDMIDAYIELHKLGFAHSSEAWRDGKLVGGLYGISLGRMFFGESMFAFESNASKAAFITLVRDLKTKGFEYIDCQVYTDHLASLGARDISRSEFTSLLVSNRKYETFRGSWSSFLS